MKYLSIFLVLTLLVCTHKAIAAETQTNVSGSNTSIEGGYTGGAPLMKMDHHLVQRLTLPAIQI